MLLYSKRKEGMKTMDDFLELPGEIREVLKQENNVQETVILVSSYYNGFINQGLPQEVACELAMKVLEYAGRRMIVVGGSDTNIEVIY